MTTRERLHVLVDELSDHEAASALRLLDARRQGEQVEVAESEMAPLPPGWGRTLTGEPMPNVAAAVRRSREEH